MGNPDPFESIYPDVLENSASEVGDLIGQALELRDESAAVGTAPELFSPPKKPFGLAAFSAKNAGIDPVYLLFDMDLAIELAGRLVMLPQDEINAHKKQKALDGDLLDAFSEIANIVSGVLNQMFHESFPEKKIRLVKGNIETYPGKTKDVPLPEGTLSSHAGNLAFKGENLGFFQLFYSHGLLERPDAEEKAPAAGVEANAADVSDIETAAKKDTAVPDQTTAKTAGGHAGKVSSPGESPGKPPGKSADASESPVSGGAKDTPVEEAAAGEAAGTEALPAEDLLGEDLVREFLIEGLEPVREELEALLGYLVAFEEQKTVWRKKSELLARTRGKQVLTRIRVSGEKEGYGYILLPLKDAVYFGGLLLMMPADSIAQVVKNGTFDGEVADAFGELANILVGCYSNQFKSAFPRRLTLKRDSLEAIVSGKTDPESDHPFPEDDYYLVSARIRMGDKHYGPIELFFPAGIMGLSGETSGDASGDASGDTIGVSGFEPAPAPGAASAAKPAANPADAPRESQKPGDQKSQSQNFDSQTQPEAFSAVPRIVTIIGKDDAELKKIENSIRETGAEINRLDPDENLKDALSEDDTGCVFLLVSKVNDQGLARAIQVKAAMSKKRPLILAGPEWTKTMVIKARRYGADDILVTPADEALIRKKCRKYMES